MPGLLRSLFDRRAAAQNDQVGKRDLLAAAVLATIEVLLDLLQRAENLREHSRLVHFPILLRLEANACTVRSAALVRAAEGRRRSPGSRDQLGDRQTGGEDLALERSNLRLADQRMIHGRHRVLPDLGLRGNQLAKIARDRAHVAVRQLVPRLREGVRELLGVGKKAPRDLRIDRVHPQGEVRREHDRSVPLRSIMSIRNRSRSGSVLGRPLLCTGRALGQFPLITEQVFQVVVVPLGWFGGPCAFQAAGDRVGAIAVAKGVLPAEALLFNPGALGFGANVFVRIGSAVSLAEGMAAGNQREGLLVVHRHAAEGLADIAYSSGWIRLSIGSFRIHVNQAHLDSAERMVELTFALIAFVPQPLALGTPENVLLRYPHVLAAAAEAEAFSGPSNPTRHFRSES